MHRFLLTFFLIVFFSYKAFAEPKIKLIHKRSPNNLAILQVKNESNSNLVCYVAIDGHKKHFKLGPFQKSKSFKATHPKFNSTHFSVWCDYA